MCLQVLTLGSSGKMLSTRRLYLGLSGPQQPQTPATKTEMAISEAWPPTFCNYSCLHASQTTENWGQEMELVTLLSQSSWGRNVELSIGSMEPDCKTHSCFLLWLMDERLRQSKLTLESGAGSDRSPRIDQHELALQAAVNTKVTSHQSRGSAAKKSSRGASDSGEFMQCSTTAYFMAISF